MNTQPLVTIQCLAYNHAPYIRQCLDGFVMQQTNFSFHAVVHDDASTDGTSDIIREYAERFPHIIKPILETENQWKKGKGVLTRIMEEACCNSKYLATCDGDDYWTDSLKLQKQVDFLEANPDFSICFHNVEIYDQRNECFLPHAPADDLIPEETSLTDLIPYCYITSTSVMYRQNAGVREKLKRVARSVAGDYPKHILYAEQGKIKRLPERMGVYRMGVGVWSGSRGSDFRNTVEALTYLGSLVALIDDPNTRELLHEKTIQYKRKIIQQYNRKNTELNNLYRSPALRIGKVLLTPYSLIMGLKKTPK